MTAITPNLIKELRDRTGVSMTLCKKALEEAAGNIDKAIENLRKAGAASAVKRSGRDANEGLIAFAENDRTVALVELTAETDFVVNNERFREFLAFLAKEAAALHPTSVEDLLKKHSSIDSKVTLEEMRTALVQALGENIQVKRVQCYDKGANRSVGVYRHLGGKIAVVVELEGAGENELAASIGMHAAATSPLYARPEDVPAAELEQEKDIARVQMKGKPENILNKIIEGKMNAFYDSVCLLRQKYVRDEELTIQQLIEKRAKESNKKLNLIRFTRWTAGEKI